MGQLAHQQPNLHPHRVRVQIPALPPPQLQQQRRLRHQMEGYASLDLDDCSHVLALGLETLTSIWKVLLDLPLHLLPPQLQLQHSLRRQMEGNQPLETDDCSHNFYLGLTVRFGSSYPCTCKYSRTPGVSSSTSATGRRYCCQNHADG